MFGPHQRCLLLPFTEARVSQSGHFRLCTLKFICCLYSFHVAAWSRSMLTC